MSSYRGTANRPDKAKAIAAVVLVHAALATAILTGLNVHTVRRAVEQLTTIDVVEPPPPPPCRPRLAATRPQQKKDLAGAPAPKAEPTPVVAPQPRIPVQSPIPAAKVAGTGSSPNSGASTVGTGTGAGGSGTGRGGGGYGDYSRFTPARLTSNIPNFEYMQLASTGIRSGSVGVPDPRQSRRQRLQLQDCPVQRRSVDRWARVPADRPVRAFQPARDPDGRPVAQDITYFPNWRRR